MPEVDQVLQLRRLQWCWINISLNRNEHSDDGCGRHTEQKYPQKE